MPFIDIGYVLSGFIVGSLVGMTGVGGGSLMTPLLIFLGAHPLTAVGTDLCYACVTKVAGSAFHSRKGTVDWTIVGRLALGSVPASLVTMYLIHTVGVSDPRINIVVTRILAFALLLTAGVLIFRGHITEAFAKRVRALSPARTRKLTIATGVLLGVLVTISSIGAGALGVTVLILLYPDRPIARLVGSDISHAVPLTMVAGTGHLALGTVDIPLIGLLLIGSLPGIFIGTYYAQHVSNDKLRYILAVTLVLVAMKIFF